MVTAREHGVTGRKGEKQLQEGRDSETAKTPLSQVPAPSRTPVQSVRTD